jgi:hypothetical protein
MRAKEREPSSLITAGPKSFEDHLGDFGETLVLMV